MGWVIAILASMAFSEPLVIAGSCGSHVPEPVYRTLAVPVDVPVSNAGGASDPARSGGTVEMADADIERYLSLHSGFARGETRLQLMPWSELRTLAR